MLKIYKRYNFKNIIWIAGIVILPVFVYAIYCIWTADGSLIPLSAIALIAGAIVENIKLSDNRWTTVKNTLRAFVASFLAFMPGKWEDIYRFNDHITFRPYVFLAGLILIELAHNTKKVIAKLSEGTTLILSVVIIYRVIDHWFTYTSSIFLKIIMWLGLLFSLYSILNAFTKIRLTRNNRFILSIRSSIIMILLAIDNIYTVSQNGSIEKATSIGQGISIGLGYFLLGVCAVYIVQNIIMIVWFLPSKNRWFNKAYFQDIKKLKEEHIQRYSNRQTKIGMSICCFFLAGIFLWVNYQYHFLPRNTSIWIVFFVFNSILYAYERKKQIVS